MNSMIQYTFQFFTPIFENKMLLVFQEGRINILQGKKKQLKVS